MEVREQAGAASTSTTTLAGIAIEARVAGAGSPVVMLHHSFGTTPWPELAAALAEHHEVAMLDLPGFGASERPVWARDVRDLALLTGRWLDQRFGGPVAVVGCGFGGWVAAELATMSPQRASALVLVGAAGIRPREGRIADQMLVSHVAYVRDCFAEQSAFERCYGLVPSDDTLVEWDRNREMVARVAWKPYMYNRRLEALLPDVGLPALVVWGSEDRVVPLECAERFASLLGAPRPSVLDGAGHAVDIERPREVAALVASHLEQVVAGAEQCS